ncbi:SCF E3 ubiquitin ligase complex F-box protein GRR1-like [Aphidius gifuensis]|uniref:SCF E3 ubiquitin ligase complex F-box protein GRR1-like n=1 Tax=Aphidius gifuensis TaxID=684658 RepID=UPI001CDD6F27|nr:SCF E3 ubiquitin ligase complex F-box protein GRR1-like [Aphidius gifuensis]
MISKKEISHAEENQQLFDDVDQKKDAINFLDNYSLAEIFMLLPIPDRMAMEKICPKWKEACKLAWYDIKKYKCSHTIDRAHNDQLLTQSYVEKLLLFCGIYIKELSLSKICNSSMMPMIGEHCENLTRLEFVHNGKLKFNANGYIEAFTKLKKLKYIEIQLIHMDWCLRRKFPWEAINYLPEEMNEIHLLIGQSLSKEAVFFDLKRFKNLQKLTLIGCNLNKILQAISEKTTLNYLDLAYFRLTKKCTFNIEHVFNQLVNLEHVSITIDKSNLNVPSSILNTCKNIRHLYLPTLNIELRPEISIENRENWENLKNLEHLTISWKITDEIAIKLVKYCKKLKHLDISKMNTDVIESALQKLTKLENLECLKVGPIHNFSGETIAAISNNCKKLKNLKMNGRYSMIWALEQPRPSSVLNYLLKLQYLEQLSLPWTTINELDEKSIIAIVDTCKNLMKLNLNFCRNITETTLIALTNSESLKKLKVAYIDNVTDNFISKLKGLKYLDFRGCKNITDAGVIQLINNCPDLEYLNIYNTHVTTDTIIGASEATKNRSNNIILYLCVEKILKKSFKSLNKSIWLALDLYS